MSGGIGHFERDVMDEALLWFSLVFGVVIAGAGLMAVGWWLCQCCRRGQGVQQMVAVMPVQNVMAVQQNGVVINGVVIDDADDVEDPPVEQARQ